jgi:hypothetical protein
MSVVLTRWRTLPALLLHPSPSERTPLEVSGRAVRNQAEDLAKELGPFLQTFVAPDQDNLQKQCHHMHSMIFEAAKLGYALLSHTSDWSFIYKDLGTPRAVVLCVGLQKLSHRDGRQLTSPQLVVEPRLATMYYLVELKLYSLHSYYVVISILPKLHCRLLPCWSITAEQPYGATWHLTGKRALVTTIRV